MLHHREELQVRVGVVSFAVPARARRFREELGFDGPVLCDPDRELYTRFGFGRASVARTWLHPRVWLRHAQLVRRGRRLRPAEDDTQQLGGDVLLDARGGVVWVHRSRGPEDRPSLDELRRVLPRAGGPSPPPVAPPRP